MAPESRTALAALLIALSIAACDAPRRRTGHVLDAGRPKPEDSGVSDGGGAPTDAGGQASLTYDIDCALAAAPSIPADSPRILILGPTVSDTAAIAEALQGILDADPAFDAPSVSSQAIDIAGDPDAAFNLESGASLMYFFYAPESRESRLAALESPLTYVVLLEQERFAVAYPEYYFEGVRALGCAARGAGAKPVVLMTWSADAADTESRGEIAYRVANGTGAILAPAGFAWKAAVEGGGEPGDDLFVAAATLYSTLTGRNAADTGYAPGGIPAERAAALAGFARGACVSEAARAHYATPYRGVVRQESMARGGAFRFADWGTSSEALWHNQIIALLAAAGFTPEGTAVTANNVSKTCDPGCAEALRPHFEAEQYALFYARDYAFDAGTLEAMGPQKSLQLQVWDRHADDIPKDGLEAVGMMEWILTTKYDQAKALGLALTPYHLMFARLKTLRPAIDLTSDGTHASAPVVYGQAVMSIVSRTGIRLSTAGLDEDTRVAAELAEDTVRQLSTLSVSGRFVPDDPGARPAP